MDILFEQPPGRPSNLSAGHTQGYHRPRGPATQPQWGPRVPSSVQNQIQPGSAYDYPQRGTYPPQTTQYPQQSYGRGYPQQPPPRNNLSAGWEQRPAAPVQTPGGYDYYGQGQAIGMGIQPPNPASAPTSASVNYNYGQPQAAGYGQSNPYSQSGPPQQGYGHGYNEPKYDNQAPTQQMYGQQQQPPVSSQPGFYPQQGSTTPQTGCVQQPPYNKSAAYAGALQSYGAPRATQPGDQMYQGQVPSTYGSSGPTQQSYPYGSSAPSPQPGQAYGQNYGPAAGVADGYNQAPPAGYSQSNIQVAPGYGQGGQPGPAYTQPGGQSGGYGQYPQVQPSYGEQSAPNVNYGYQGVSGDAGYGNSAPSSGYGPAPAVGGTQPGYGQTGGYVQPSANDQSMAPQAGYGSHPGSAPVGYAKGVSPQPGGYAGQYDSVPMYGHH